MKLLNSILWGCLLCGGVFFASWGDQFEGGGYIHQDVTRVAVTILKNNSSETGAGIAFTNALIEEILERTDTTVVDPSQATVVLEGTIKAITFSILSRSTTESVVDRRVWGTIDVKLMRTDGEVIWSVKDFTSHEDYTVSEDKVEDEQNISEAVDKIAIRTAEKLVSKLMTNF
jgi:hypothetical protein